MFERDFRDKQGDRVNFVDVSGDESVAVSAHRNTNLLIWDVTNAADWKCLHVLKDDWKMTACVTISADKSQIVIVDWGGKVYVWDLRNGKTLAALETELEFESDSHRNAISRDGECFL